MIPNFAFVKISSGGRALAVELRSGACLSLRLDQCCPPIVKDYCEIYSGLALVNWTVLDAVHEGRVVIVDYNVVHRGDVIRGLGVDYERAGRP